MKTFVTLSLCLVAAFAAGCIKVRVTVQMNEDGSGEVREEVVFSEKLVSLSRRAAAPGPTTAPDVPSIDELTGEARLKVRVAKMGSGVRFAGRQLETLKDGSIRLVATYAYDDINTLRVTPIPFGVGWEDAYLAFDLAVTSGLWNQCQLRITMNYAADRRARGRPELADLGQLDVQNIRQLLPVFKDMLEGFELSLRLEFYGRDQWATVTRGHPATFVGSVTSLSDFPNSGGRLTIFQITDRHLDASEDGMLIVLPWRQEGREMSLYARYGGGPSPPVLPYVNCVHAGGHFIFLWRFYNTPHGREYF